MKLELMRSLDEKLEILRASPPSPALLATLKALASLLKTYDPLRAITLAKESIQIAQVLVAHEQEARAWAIRAYAECQLEMDEDANRHGKIALTLSEVSQDPITMGYAYFAIGGYLVNQFRNDEALEAGLKAYELLERAGDIAAQANTAYVIMGSYSRLGNRQQAEAYAFRAVEQYRELNSPGGELLQLNNLAMHFLWMGEPETSRRLGEEAVLILRRLMANNQPFEFAYTTGAVMHTLAEIAIAQNDLDSAEGFLKEGLAFIHADDSQISPNDESFLMLALGKLYYRRGEKYEARKSLLTAFWKTRRSGNRALMAEITQELTIVYEALGYYRRALRYFRMYHDIDKARYYDHLVTKVRHLEVEYDVKVARREMELLTEKNQQLEQAYTDLQAANAQIRELSIRDGLTKLYNRQYFEEWATAAFRQSQHSGHDFAVFLCDVDNFKRINDTWLHHIGDRVLQIVAAELEAICPAQGNAARYGGEEFVVAVPRYTITQILTLAEQFRQRVEHYPWGEIQPSLHVTVSIGVMASTGISTLAQQLIQADVNLYMAKRHGKNRVEGDEDTMMPVREHYTVHLGQTG